MSEREPTRLNVVIAGISITVPIWRDAETTQRIVDRVNDRIQEIEGRSRRVNTQMFALEAAFSFAQEVAKLEAARQQDETDLSEALEHLASKLRTSLQGPKLRKLPGGR
ncbi:MAG: cell division protein ZapA [bacterium]|nr:cell division protein ZapA [bacterium]